MTPELSTSSPVRNDEAVRSWQLLSFFALFGLLFVAFPAAVVFATLHSDASMQPRVLPLAFSGVVLMLPATLLVTSVRRKLRTGRFLALPRNEDFRRRVLSGGAAWEWFALHATALIRRFLLPGSALLTAVFGLAALMSSPVDTMTVVNALLWGSVTTGCLVMRLRRSRATAA